MKYVLCEENAQKKLQALSNNQFSERLDRYARALAEAHIAGRVTDSELRKGVTVGVWIGECIVHIRIEWQDIKAVL